MPIQQMLFICFNKNDNPKAPNDVCLLNKALHGLHHSGKKFYFEFIK